jgi:RHS repeat-associated protein
MEGWDRNKSIDTCGCNIIQKAEKDFANHLIDTNVYPTPKQYVEQVFNCGKPLLDYDLHKYICFSALNGLCIDSTLVKLTPNDSLAKSITPAINWSTSRYCPLGGTRMLKTYASPTDSGAFLDGYYWVKWIPAPTHSATYILHELGWAGSKDNLSNLNSCVPPVCCSKLCNRPFNEIPLIVENPCKTLLKNAAYLNANSAYKAYRDSMEGVFKVAYIKKCMFTDQVEQMEDLYKQQQYQYTLYYYDQAGNLVKTVPPAGVRPLNNEQAQGLVVLRKLGSTAKFTPSHKMITTYAYNSLNSPIWQKTPDAGESWFYYDQLGRLVVSQNGNQRTVVNSQTRYSYTVFDNLNRITEVGQLSQASPITDDKLRVSADLTAWISASTKEQITKTYYDLADYAVVDTFLFKPENLRNRVVYTTYQSKNNGSAYDHAVHYSYDVHGNVKMLLREIKGLNVLLQDYKIVSYDYDLVSGKVNQVIYQKGEVDQYIHQYQYDADNRLTQVFSGTSPYSLDNDASYYYYLHGPLARTELGSQKVQGVDYSYTIQGWLKAVNSGHLNSLRDMGRDGYLGASGFNGNGYLPADEFGFNLGYFEGDYQQIGTMNIGSMSTYQKPTIQTQSSAVGNQAADLFNGNIRMMAVAIRQFGTLPLTNTYRYDQLNRLIESNSWNSYDSTNNAYFSSGSALTQYKNTFNYDANGNILKQLRNGGPSQVNLDSLSYFYYTNGEDLTNKLMYVKDNVSKTNYTDDIDNQVNSNNYKYDEIGNLISDSSEEISSIEWNVYGKINRIKRYSYSIRPDLEFEYSPDGHRVVKIVKPKNGGMNVYTYYVRDAQGNVLATYNRTYSVTLDFSQMTYAKVNDTIIKYETLDGLAGLNATVSNVSGLRSLYYTNLQNDTVFAKTINPYNLLINYPGGLDSVLNNLSNEAYAEILFTMNPSITDLCECYKARNLSPDYLNSILLTMMRNEGPFDDLLDRIATQQGSAGIFSVATALGIPIGDLPTTISDIHSYVFSSSDPEASFQTLISELATQYPELSNCTGLPITILDDLKRNFPATFYSYLGNADGVRDLFRTALSSCNLAQSNEDIASRLSSTYANLSWQLLLQTNSSANLLAWERDSDTYTFTNQAIKYQKSTIASYQTSNNLYGGPYGGIENYFSQIKSYFGQTKYDQMIQGFMRASSLYMDTIRLAEWHIYGSSRVGIYEANLHLASRSVRIESGTETQVNSTAITYQSYSYFTTERGTKRFELTNHLGNVLAVVTDKKVAICSTEVFTFWKAELVSATDYAPFGAPLASRTYQASEYRFSFNGQEKIDEINGAGNDLDFGARVYDARLGRWMAGDPLEYKYPGVSPYNFSLNIPIMVNDPDGKDFRVSITKGKNGVNVITIESTIHLYGPDAEVLFSQIKGFTANGVVNIDGQEYQINITVAYTVNAKLNEAIPAEVHDRIETNLDTRKYKSMGVDRGDNIAYINSKLFMPFAGVTAQGEDDTKVKNVKPETLIHESLHMLGLDERYSFAGIDKNFFLDYMSNSPKRNDLNKIHFYDFAKFVKDNIPESASCLPVPEPKVDDTGGVSNSTHHETDDRTYRDNSSKVSKNNFYLIK